MYMYVPSRICAAYCMYHSVLAVPTCAACSVVFTHSYHSPGIVSSTAESLTVDYCRRDEEFLTVQNSVHRARDKVNV